MASQTEQRRKRISRPKAVNKKLPAHKCPKHAMVIVTRTIVRGVLCAYVECKHCDYTTLMTNETRLSRGIHNKKELV